MPNRRLKFLHVPGSGPRNMAWVEDIDATTAIHHAVKLGLREEARRISKEMKDEMRKMHEAKGSLSSIGMTPWALQDSTLAHKRDKGSPDPSRPMFDTGRLLDRLVAEAVRGGPSSWIAQVRPSRYFHPNTARTGEGQRALTGARPLTDEELATILEFSTRGGGYDPFMWFAKTADHAGPRLLRIVSRDIQAVVESHLFNAVKTNVVSGGL